MLDALNLLLSDVRYGLGAYLGVYLLTEHGWDAGHIGLALSAGGLAGLLAGAPAGALVDAVRAKRGLVAGGTLTVAAACLAIPLAPGFWPVVAMGVLGSVAGTVIGPAVTAISLGVVGPARFARRVGRNEALFHAGNAACNLVVLATVGALGAAVVFLVLAATALASVPAVLALPARAIDHDLARGRLPGALPCGARNQAWGVLFASPPLLVFAASGALFHLANAAMLPLLGQRLALLVPDAGIGLTAASAIVAQSVMVPTALLAGASAGSWGRKPLLLAAFAVLVIRGVLCALTAEPGWLIASQLLDGVGAGLVGALFPVVVADLTRGSGRFNAACGVVGTVHGMGGVLSAALAGQVASHAGYAAAFLVLAAIAAAGGALFWLAMPETRVLAPAE